MGESRDKVATKRWSDQSLINVKKALITGADGFIGSHLTEMLVSMGFEVRALSQYNSFNSWGWLDDIHCLDQIEVFTGDIRDPRFCEQITQGVDIIFHLAALIAIHIPMWLQAAMWTLM